MQDLSLEKEFAIYVQLHKTTILTARIIKYYRDLYNTGITFPEFMQERPEKRAEKDVINLIATDFNKFNNLYEEAWKEFADALP